MTQAATQSVMAAFPTAAVLIDSQDRISGANQLAETLLGEALIGRNIITVMRQPSVLDALEGTRDDGQQRHTRYLVNDGGSETTYDVCCSLLSGQEVNGVVLCFTDMTHLEQAGQMRRDFVANVSHELRTPLTALLGFIETLLGAARDDPAARERFLGIMSKEAERMNRLVSDLLSLSQVESEERMRPADHVDLVDMLESTIRRLDPLAGNSQVEITQITPDSPVQVAADEDQLRQVFTNLIENAIKYGGDGCKVTVEISTPDHERGLRGQGVRVSVRDTGPGIAQIHLPRLTERFYRVDSHRSREMGGTGLGLAIVKHIINRHRGRLKIESEPGEGTQFTVILPVV